MNAATHRGGRRRDQPLGAEIGHAHGHGSPPDLDIARGPRIVVVLLLVLAGVAVAVGIVGLWPDRSQVDRLGHSLSFAGPGVTFPHATVESVNPCPPPRSGCDTLTVRVDGGGRATVPVGPDVIGSGLGAGDGIQVQRNPGAAGRATYAYFSTDCGWPLWLLVGLFVLVVVAVARWRGVLALVGLAVGAVVIGGWMLPGLLSGHPPVLVAVVGSAAILYVVLYLAHGVSLRTSAVLLGTLGGLGLTALFGLASVRVTHLTGVSEEGGTVLSSVAHNLGFQDLMTAPSSSPRSGSPTT